MTKQNETSKQQYKEKDGYSTCAICGKRVYTGMVDLRQWAYRTSHKFACSYSCMTKLLKKYGK